MRRILDIISSAGYTTTLLERLALAHAGSPVRVRRLAGSLRALTAGIVHQRTGRPVLMVLEDPAACADTYSDLVTAFGPERALIYHTGHHSVTTAPGTLDAEMIGLTDALGALARDPFRVIVTDPESLLAAVPPPAQLIGNEVELALGHMQDPEELTRRLALGGFERVQVVESMGQYAMRGGIVDLFPVATESPVRLEFFGNTIDSIREFDPVSQRSVRERQAVRITARLFHAEDTQDLTSALPHHLRDDTIVFIDEPERVEGFIETAGRADLIPHLYKHSTIQHSALFARGGADLIEPDARVQPAFGASLQELCKGVEALQAEGLRVFLTSDGPETRARITDMIDAEWERADEAGETYTFAPSTIQLADTTLSSGFIVPGMHLAVLTEHEVFNRRRARVQGRKARAFKGFTLRELKQLRTGDFLVHVDKGIGKFLGLETISVSGSKGEAVKMEYARGDVLYVNLNYINRLQKYSSREGATPKLSRLGTEEWERAKARTKKRVKDIARELIRLYAERKSQPGFAYPADTAWQRELEASFIYEDTPDQASATYAVKQDMQSAVPMDRLICGDVGFGKTEVAVRAAFKAVQAGRQVAILAPTTILAQQHYNTFRDRLGRYAVNIGLMSRFRTKQEQEKTLTELKLGTVDVLIGTHRILSKDVRFKNLGLLVVDEEQRFGVSAKEKLRQVRATVDTLTLTATPIPRTLNFTLMGARDLSVIETPPRNRLPITTELMRWNDAAITEAIRRELARGGQCFVVHWRIGDIDLIAAQIRELVPEARIAIGHGEMQAEQLEKTMSDFIERKFDVLVATKIIESGIDIPTANTIIINRADAFGLAELYQLRGRVGRSNIQAYALMLIPPAQSLSRNALRRLQALEEFSELGSGLKLAMRDLEIRGAGNLLGAEQSGFIDEVGFELYQRIVDEAVHELKTGEFSDVFHDEVAAKALPVNEDVTIEIDGDALIPKKYIADDADRYDFYYRMYTARDTQGLTSVANELRDRYGSPPEETQRLITAIRLRLAAMPTGVARVTYRNGSLRLELPPESDKRFYDTTFQPLMKIVGGYANAQVKPEKKQVVIVFWQVTTAEAAEALLTGLAMDLAAAGKIV